MSSSIPEISLTALRTQAELDRLAHACREWGFFYLVDHGIPEDVQARFHSAAARFFALDDSEKHQVSRTETNPWGYFERELTKNRQDWKEIFDLGIDQEDETWESRTPWPDLPGFRETMLDWHGRCEAISLALIQAVCRTLDDNTDRLVPFFSPVNSSFLRLNHYPVCTEPADPADDFPDTGHLGIHHHTDAGALTVLLQDTVSGLQVRRHEAWHTVEARPDSLIINVGDLVQVWSNDRYQAPLHRVLANAERERYSAAYFFNPAFSTLCQPLTPEPHRYRPVNWGEFRAARAAGDYADQGEEIQITDYRVR